MVLEMINGEAWFLVLGQSYHAVSLISGLLGGIVITLASIWVMLKNSENKLNQEKVKE